MAQMDSSSNPTFNTVTRLVLLLSIPQSSSFLTPDPLPYWLALDPWGLVL